MENIGRGESGVMCCKLMKTGKVEQNSTNLSAKDEGDLLMGATWLVVYVIYHLGLTIIFVGCGDCPEFLP